MIIDILLLIEILILIIGICFLPVPFIYLRYFIKHCYEYYKEKPTYIKTVGDLIHHSHEITKIWIDDFNAAKLRHIAIISFDIPPTIAPKKAPIPVVTPDNITYIINLLYYS